MSNSFFPFQEPLNKLGMWLIDGSYSVGDNGGYHWHQAQCPTPTLKLKFRVDEKVVLKAEKAQEHHLYAPNGAVRRLFELALNPSVAFENKDPIVEVSGQEGEQWYLINCNHTISHSQANVRDMEVEIRGVLPDVTKPEQFFVSVRDKEDFDKKEIHQISSFEFHQRKRHREAPWATGELEKKKKPVEEPKDTSSVHVPPFKSMHSAPAGQALTFKKSLIKPWVPIPPRKIFVATANEIGAALKDKYENIINVSVDTGSPGQIVVHGTVCRSEPYSIDMFNRDVKMYLGEIGPASAEYEVQFIHGP